MSDHPEQTADQARTLVEQAQALARAENYPEAFRTLQEAVTIYQRLAASPNGAVAGGGATVPLAEYQRLEAMCDSYRNVLLATLPTDPEWTQKEIDDIQAGRWVSFEEVLAEIEKGRGDQG
jgi:hypothetical protein